MTDREAVLALERAGWEALSGRGAAEFYDRVMATGAVMVFASGVMQRDEALAAMRGATPWESYRLDDEQVMLPAEDVAVVTYRAAAKRRKGPEYRAWMASIYIRDGEEWSLAVHQQSPVP